jgi:hypothetical protein
VDFLASAVPELLTRRCCYHILCPPAEIAFLAGWRVVPAADLDGRTPHLPTSQQASTAAVPDQCIQLKEMQQLAGAKAGAALDVDPSLAWHKSNRGDNGASGPSYQVGFLRKRLNVHNTSLRSWFSCRRGIGDFTCPSLIASRGDLRTSYGFGSVLWIQIGIFTLLYSFLRGFYLPAL